MLPALPAPSQWIPATSCINSYSLSHCFLYSSFDLTVITGNTLTGILF